MRRLGFPEPWIIVVATLYRLACSSILVVGGRGRRFQISRSIHQGCPLAPFLFLIVMEVFSIYLNSAGVGIQGFVTSISDKMILDVEFTYDIALYMHGKEGYLRKAQVVVKLFVLFMVQKLIGVKKWVLSEPREKIK